MNPRLPVPPCRSVLRSSRRRPRCQSGPASDIGRSSRVSAAISEPAETSSRTLPRRTRDRTRSHLGDNRSGLRPLPWAALAYAVGVSRGVAPELLTPENLTPVNARGGDTPPSGETRVANPGQGASSRSRKKASTSSTAPLLAVDGQGGVALALQLDPAEGWSELSVEPVETAVPEAPPRRLDAENGAAGGGPGLDRRKVGGGEIEIVGAGLADREGQRRPERRPGPRPPGSTIMASANPPVKHIPSTPTPTPPSSACSLAGRARSQVATGDVFPDQPAC